MMFGRRKQTETVSPKVLEKLDRDALYALFSKDRWETLTAETRLMLLQEVENRRARIDGREPVPVIMADDPEFLLDAGVLGCYVHQDNVIKINHRFLKRNSPLHTGTRALETVLHEGRHACQMSMIKEKPDQLPQHILLEWISCHVKYFDGDGQGSEGEKLRLLYAFQSIEVDARRFARMELVDTIRSMEARGIPCKELYDSLYNSLLVEDFMNQRLRKLMTLEDIDRYEQMVIREMEKAFPGVTFDGLKPFREARNMIEQPGIDRFKERLERILMRDAIETDRINAIRQDHKLDEFDAQVDKKSGMNRIRRPKVM